MNKRAIKGLGLSCVLFMCVVGSGWSQQPQRGQLQPYTETLAGTLVSFEMVLVPAGTVYIADPGLGDREMTVEVGPFWIGRTEVTWDEFDVWMLGLDAETAGDVDAESRPSSPYGAPDRGFGHAGFAAISLSSHSAEQYALWLSEKTGRPYRLPTAAEWQHACLLGVGAGDPGAVPRQLDTPALDERAWHHGNSSGSTHPVASKAPDLLGLFDMLGNAGEWASSVRADGKPALFGGSYRDEPTEMSCGGRAEQTPAWNASDPQIPQSRWWLADAPFAGFRIVRDPGDRQE